MLYQKKYNGSALVVSLIILAIIVISALNLSLIAVQERKASIGESASNRAFQMADMGIEKVMNLILRGNYTHINESETNGINYSSAEMNCNGSTGRIESSARDVSVQLYGDALAPLNCDSNERVSEITVIGSYGNAKTTQRVINAPVVNNFSKLLLHFNDNFSDSSNNGHNASAEGTVNFDSNGVSSDFNDAVSFSATSYLEIDDSEDFNFGGNDFTLEAWVKFPSSIVDYPTIISRGDSSGGSYRNSSFWFYYDTSKNKLVFQYYNEDNDNIKTLDLNEMWNPNLNQWYHIVFERNGANGYFFIDGEKKNSTGNQFGDDSIYYNSADNYPLVIGGYYTNGSFDGESQFIGQIDELRISKGVARWLDDFNVWEVEYDAND